MIDVERYLPFLKKHELHPPQFLLLLCLYMDKIGKNGKKYIDMYKEMFKIDGTSTIGKIYFDELINKGFIKIEKVAIGEPIRSKHIHLTNKFTNIFVDKYQAAKEFWDLYPAFMFSQGRKFPLTYMDEDEFREIYHTKIKGSVDEHLEVLEDLKYAVENDLIRGGIEKFVKSSQWNAIRKLRRGDSKAIIKGNINVEDI